MKYSKKEIERYAANLIKKCDDREGNCDGCDLHDEERSICKATEEDWFKQWKNDN